MKKMISRLSLLFLVSFMHAQYSDLGSLSEGQLTNFQSILDNDDHLYGYLAIYQLDNIDEDTKKFEYVLLDKNLNQVSSQEFNSNNLAGNYYGYIAGNGEFILRPDLSADSKRDLKTKEPPTFVIDTDNSTMKEKVYYCYEDDNLQVCEKDENTILEQIKDEEKERKKKGYIKDSYVRELKDGGFLVYDYTEMGKRDYGSYTTDERFQKFDKDLNKVWEFTFNNDASRTESEGYAMVGWEDDYAYFLKYVKENYDYHYYLVAMDMNKGEIISEFDVTRQFPEFRYGHMFYYKDKNIDNTYDSENFFRVLSLFSGNLYNMGYMTFTFDKRNNFFYADNFKYLDLNKVATDIEFTEKGDIVGEKESIITRDIYFLEDGSVGMLAEKIRSKGKKVITTDLVVISTDKDLVPQEVIVLEKDKSKTYRANDYLFSQYINDGKDVVFFYRDFQKDDDTKDKNWVLYINTIIDGKFHQEQIPISSDENFIYPSMAKEGYILLREFNKNDKYDQIRLERLNY